MGLARQLSRLFFRMTGYRLVVQTPRPPGSAVLVAAPHTSNWDFVFMMAISGATGTRFRWLGKSGIFRFPFGPLMRALGGIPVDRSSSHGLVSAMAGRLSEEETVLVLTPKGTRGKRDYWKSGFYRIAEEAGVPLLLAFVDSSTRTAGLGPALTATGDARADMEQIRRFYAGKLGVRPELTSVPRLRSEDGTSDAPAANE